MPIVNITRRLPSKTIGNDIDSLNALGTVEGYLPVRIDASPEALKTNFGYQLKPGQVDCARDWAVVTKTTV